MVRYVRAGRPHGPDSDTSGSRDTGLALPPDTGASQLAGCGRPPIHYLGSPVDHSSTETVLTMEESKWSLRSKLTILSANVHGLRSNIGPEVTTNGSGGTGLDELVEELPCTSERAYKFGPYREADYISFFTHVRGETLDPVITDGNEGTVKCYQLGTVESSDHYAALAQVHCFGYRCRLAAEGKYSAWLHYKRNPLPLEQRPTPDSI
ncbi:hypothetical protein E2C01_056259 [Portunus trituberculatus]|uniref:Uncharacterized protein n=1 Tax=Portunus trituberculatus TaxID=210409 RepID=A0A5B7GXL9_PORTR|nr:hypothetical protein [Portunus trituberculatus]